MIHRFIGVSLGAIVTFAILWASTVANPADLIPWYLAAVIIGAAASFLWPVIVAWRARNRMHEWREEEIQREVERQMAEQAKGD